MRAQRACLQRADGKFLQLVNGHTRLQLGQGHLARKGLSGHLNDRSVVVSLGAATRSLVPGGYIVQLRGERDDGSTEQVQSYSFRTVRK